MKKPRSRAQLLENVLSSQDHDLLIRLKGDVYWLRMQVLGLYPLLLALLGFKIWG